MKAGDPLQELQGWKDDGTGEALPVPPRDPMKAGDLMEASLPPRTKQRPDQCFAEAYSRRNVTAERLRRPGVRFEKLE